MKKRALITGITGMDGSHMADLLLSKGYEVYGIARSPTSQNIEHLPAEIEVFSLDIKDPMAVRGVVEDTSPNEIYNFASQSSVAHGWEDPIETNNTNATGVVNLLETIRSVDLKIRFFQASSCEMFGDRDTHEAQDESTPFWPRNPYALSKLYGHWITKNYRDTYGMFCCCGILYSHESERRSQNFVSRKITSEVAKIHLGLSDGFSLGNINTGRDWGYAPDYMIAIWKMLQQDIESFHSKKHGDFIVATGEVKMIKDFLREAFAVIGISNWKKYVAHDSDLVRPQDTPALCGNASKAKRVLGWVPTTSFQEMVHRMVTNDIELLRSIDA
tara:strand:- start:2821 stop:3810 length:990 start_codon:yes stop_codon:yes gene_type:complete